MPLYNQPASGGGGISPPAGDIGGTAGTPTVVATHLTAALPIGQGGTGTGSTSQSFALTGPTSGSGAPAFRALVAGDLPAGTTSTQGALQLDGTATHIQPDGTQAQGSNGLPADSGHIHPENAGWTAGDQGLKAWNFDIALASSVIFTSNPAAGTVYLARLAVRTGMTVSKIGLWWIQPSGASPAGSYLALFNSSGTQVGSTTSDLTGTSSGFISPSITSQTLTAGIYYVGLLIGTQGSTKGGAVTSGSALVSGVAGSANLAAGNYRWMSYTVAAPYSSMPSSVTYSSGNQIGFSYWCALL